MRRVPIDVHRAANALHHSHAQRTTYGHFAARNLPINGRMFARCLTTRSDRPNLTHEIRSAYVVTCRHECWTMLRFWCGVRSFRTVRMERGAGSTCARCTLAVLGHHARTA